MCMGINNPFATSGVRRVTQVQQTYAEETNLQLQH